MGLDSDVSHMVCFENYSMAGTWYRSFSITFCGSYMLGALALNMMCMFIYHVNFGCFVYVGGFLFGTRQLHLSSNFQLHPGLKSIFFYPFKPKQSLAHIPVIYVEIFFLNNLVLHKLCLTVRGKPIADAAALVFL